MKDDLAMPSSIKKGDLYYYHPKKIEGNPDVKKAKPSLAYGMTGEGFFIY